MSSWWTGKTAEERKAAYEKGAATRRANVEARKAARHDALTYAGGLRDEISSLEQRLDELKRMEVIMAASSALTGKALLRQEEIADAALSWSKVSGVYFLLDGREVVYVGQSVDVYSRISEHREKKFDRYAYIPCEKGLLDVLESLYIHCFRPKLNGNTRAGVKNAPVAFDDLISLISKHERH